MASKDFCKKFVAACKNKVIIRTHISEGTDDSGREKFGRLLGEIVNPDTKEVLNEQLIAKNYAVKYMGENKESVRDKHMANRKLLIDRGDVKMDYKTAGL